MSENERSKRPKRMSRRKLEAEGAGEEDEFDSPTDDTPSSVKKKPNRNKRMNNRMCSHRGCPNQAGYAEKPHAFYCSRSCQFREQNLRQNRVKADETEETSGTGGDKTTDFTTVQGWYIPKVYDPGVWLSDIETGDGGFGGKTAGSASSLADVRVPLWTRLSTFPAQLQTPQATPVPLFGLGMPLQGQKDRSLLSPAAAMNHMMLQRPFTAMPMAVDIRRPPANAAMSPPSLPPASTPLVMAQRSPRHDISVKKVHTDTDVTSPGPSSRSAASAASNPPGSGSRVPPNRQHIMPASSITSIQPQGADVLTGTVDTQAQASTAPHHSVGNGIGP